MGLQFTDDSTIKALNASWREQNVKTDVLSFPVIDDAIILPHDQSLEIGDIVVSVMTAECQAIEHNHSLATELLWLVSHGLMHLLGWEHPNLEKLQEMLRYQKQLLSINGNLQSKEEKTLGHNRNAKQQIQAKPKTQRRPASC